MACVSLRYDYSIKIEDSTSSYVVADYYQESGPRVMSLSSGAAKPILGDGKLSGGRVTPDGDQGWLARAAAGYDLFRVLGRMDLAINYPELGVVFEQECLHQVASSAWNGRPSNSPSGNANAKFKLTL